MTYALMGSAADGICSESASTVALGLGILLVLAGLVLELAGVRPAGDWLIVCGCAVAVVGMAWWSCRKPEPQPRPAHDDQV